MENNEIMVNEELVTATEGLAPAFPKKGLIIAGVTAATLIVGGLVYAKVVKPALARAKAEKERRAREEEIEYEILEDAE